MKSRTLNLAKSNEVFVKLRKLDATYRIVIQLIHFHFPLLVITNFETQNKYRIRNTLGQQVYFAAEGEFFDPVCSLHQQNPFYCLVLELN